MERLIISYAAYNNLSDTNFFKLSDDRGLQIHDLCCLLMTRYQKKNEEVVKERMKGRKELKETAKDRYA